MTSEVEEPAGDVRMHELGVTAVQFLVSLRPRLRARLLTSPGPPPPKRCADAPGADGRPPAAGSPRVRVGELGAARARRSERTG